MRNSRSILDRLQATGQVFELTPEQQKYLTEHGVSTTVVSQMQNLNRASRDQILSESNGAGSAVISQPPSSHN